MIWVIHQIICHLIRGMFPPSQGAETGLPPSQFLRMHGYHPQGVSVVGQGEKKGKKIITLPLCRLLVDLWNNDSDLKDRKICGLY